MTIVSLSAPTGAYSTGILADDYAYIYSNTFTPAREHTRISYLLYNSGTVSGINYTVDVTNDPNESLWVTYVSGTILTKATTGVDFQNVGYAFSRVGMRIDYSGGTAISGFAWVGVRG